MSVATARRRRCRARAARSVVVSSKPFLSQTQQPLVGEADSIDQWRRPVSQFASGLFATEGRIVDECSYPAGCDLGIDIKKMMTLSRKVAELSGIPVPATKPLVGESAYTHTLGAHQWGVRQAWATYEPVRAEAVGNVRRLPMGRLTHHLLVRDILSENGFSGLDDDTVKRVTEKVRTLAENEARFITDEELLSMAKKEIG